MTALLGAAAAVPGAVWRLKDRAAAGLRAVQARLSRHPIDVRNVTGHAHLGVAVTASATGTVTPNTLEGRIDALEQRATQIEGSVREVGHDLRLETEARKDAEVRLASQIDLLKTAIRDLEKVSTEIDANALPIVVIGIVLTSIGDWIACNTGVAVASIAVGVGSSIIAVSILVRSRPGRART